MKMIVMMGLPGSGKSTHIRGLGPAVVVSADTFFENSFGEYVFNGDKTKEAHEFCLAEAKAALEQNNDTVVVDNTNTELWQIAPYFDLGRSVGAHIEIHFMDTDPSVAFLRNQHGVPEGTFQNMAQRLEKSLRNIRRLGNDFQFKRFTGKVTQKGS